MGRHFVGIELDEAHHRTASTRLASKFKQPGKAGSGNRS
jgi:hypothetical protein